MPLDQEQKEMSFLGHLEELRWHLIRAFIALLVITIVVFVFGKQILFQKVIFGPSKTSFVTYQWLCNIAEQLGVPDLCFREIPMELRWRTLPGAFLMHLMASLIAGFVITFPYIFWEVWRFIKPALYTKEQSGFKGVVFFVTLLFLTGISFGYFIVAPFAIGFFANYEIDPTILKEFNVTSYISLVTMISLNCGLLFQLPIVAFFLTKAGLITPTFLKKYRRHAVVVIFILSAVLTPQDLFSQVVVAIPLLLLYQMSILISARVLKKEEKARKLWEQQK